MEILKSLFSEINWQLILKTGFRIVLILGISWFVTKILRKFLIGLENQLIRKSIETGEIPAESGKRIETLVRLVRQAMMLTIGIIVIMTLLKELGIEIGPIIASAGIVGLAVGFGAQNLVKDFISGFFIILENQIRVGDYAYVNGTGGLVEKINFRTIVLRDNTGIVHIFPNGSINTLSNATNEWSAYVFEIGVAYKENIDIVMDIMKETADKLLLDEKIGPNILEPMEIFGLDKLGDSALIIKARIKTKPGVQWETGREYLRRIKMAFDKNNIEIPFPHHTVYMGKAEGRGSKKTGSPGKLKIKS